MDYLTYIGGDFFVGYNATDLEDAAKKAYIDYDQDYDDPELIITVKNSEGKIKRFNCSAEIVRQYNISEISK